MSIGTFCSNFPLKTLRDSGTQDENITRRQHTNFRGKGDATVTPIESSNVCDSPAPAGTSTLVLDDIEPASESPFLPAHALFRARSSDSTVTVLARENAAYMKKVDADVATVLGKVPELSKTSNPVTVEEGSDISPWSAAEFLKHFKVRKSHRCAFNILWVALTTPTPEIRLSEKKKNELQTIMSKSPDILTIKVHADKDWTEEELKSHITAGLQMLVPVEPLHAWWGAFAAYVKDNNDEKIQEFSNLALSMPIHIMHLDSVDDCSAESMNFRESLKEMGDILRVTPLMRILHFSAWKAAYLKKQKKKIGAQALLDAYKEKNTIFGSKSEKLNPGWLDMANTIDSRMLSLAEVRDGLLEAEDFPAGTNPIEGISNAKIYILFSVIDCCP